MPKQRTGRGLSRRASRALLIVLVAWPAVATVALGVKALADYSAKRQCVLSGGVWRYSGPCIPTVDDCELFGKRMPIGTRYFDGCNTCTCLGYLEKCTSKYCTTRLPPRLLPEPGEEPAQPDSPQPSELPPAGLVGPTGFGLSMTVPPARAEGRGVMGVPALRRQPGVTEIASAAARTSSLARNGLFIFSWWGTGRLPRPGGL